MDFQERSVKMVFMEMKRRYPMCCEQWTERKRVSEDLRKARDEADKAIEKAKSAPRPQPEKETRKEPEAV